MTDMHSLIDDLLAASPEGHREMARAKLRVDVSEELLLRMQAKGITKAALASALGVSRSAVGQALSGSRNMSLNTLADMAQALHLQARVMFEELHQVNAATRSRGQALPIVVTASDCGSYQPPQVIRLATGSAAVTTQVAFASHHSCPATELQ